MSIVFTDDEATGRGLRRMARELITANVYDLDNSEMEVAKKVHECRKRCKRYRALVRLALPLSPKVFKSEDRAIRDASRGLSGYRDDAAILESLEKLIAWAPADEGAFLEPLLLQLKQQQVEATTAASGLEEALADFRSAMAARLAAIESWKIKAKGFSAIGEGLEETYRQARRRWKLALNDASDERLHDWRKEVKYHRYQVKMVSPSWPGVLEAWHQEAVLLSELLGDDHDLAILAMGVSAAPASAGGVERAAELAQLAAYRRAAIRKEVFTLASKLFAEKPGDWHRRMKTYWTSWRSGRN